MGKTKESKKYFGYDHFYAVKNDLDAEPVYCGARFDLKQTIKAISALLNSAASVTLYVYTLGWWLEYSKAPNFETHVDSYSAILRFISEEIQRAISPKVTVEYDDTIPGYDDPRRKENKAIFTIKGGTPPYSAYGQYYIVKDGEVSPSEISSSILPETPKKPIVNIGPRTEQTEYIETFADLDHGVFALRAIRNRYPYAVLYIGVKEDGTVIDPRSVEETKKDITETVVGYMKSKGFLNTSDGSSFNVDKIGDTGVVQLLLGGRYHGVFSDRHDFYTDAGEMYVRENFEIHPSRSRNWRKVPRTPYSLYELESPTRNLSFERLKKLLAANEIQWDDFETEFGVSLLNDDNRYNMFAYLMSDTIEQHICAPRITSIKLKLHNYLQFWDKKERWFFDRLNDILDYIRSLNRLRTINIDGKKTKLQYFDFEEAKEAYLCACIYQDWASQRSPAIELLITSLVIYCLPIFHKGENGELVPERNEALARLMKMYGLINGTDVSFARLQEKFGPKSIRYYGEQAGDKYIKITLPIGKRAKDAYNNKPIITILQGVRK